MNIITFTYTKPNGESTFRVISPIIIPNKMYEGTDITCLEDEDQVQYCQALGRLKDEFAQAVLGLQAEYSLENKYRRFDPTKMTNVIEEAV